MNDMIYIVLLPYIYDQEKLRRYRDEGYLKVLLLYRFKIICKILNC